MSTSAGPTPPRVTIDRHDPVHRRLEQLVPGLSASIGLTQRRFAPRVVRSRREIVHEGEAVAGIWTMRAGWAALVRHFADGRRQVQHLLLPGDPLPLERDAAYPATIVALTPVTLIDLDGTWLPDPALLDDALRRHTMATVHRLLDATARLGRQVAIERFAHLLLELRDRLRGVGLASDTHFKMPLTQEMLADTLGLTSVHVNRTLQMMRQQQLIELEGRAVTLLLPAELARMADYASPIDHPVAMH
ncbi:Crp/Fnr family transcriptional regulator [uncultured Sphingomonas sp.]|uniref:Crp/Fnr family transcriptional regulator n=1 Tax=uncultured Sphingomonas sp. TaxID=158754 RepID=UPI0030F4BB0C